jgi:hypothetical protein
MREKRGMKMKIIQNIKNFLNDPWGDKEHKEMHEKTLALITKTAALLKEHEELLDAYSNNTIQLTIYKQIIKCAHAAVCEK